MQLGDATDRQNSGWAEQALAHGQHHGCTAGHEFRVITMHAQCIAQLMDTFWRLIFKITHGTVLVRVCVESSKRSILFQV